VFGVIGLLDAFLPAWSDRRDVWTFGGDTVRWIGVVLFAVGGGPRLWPVFVLGDRFSGRVAIQPEHRLVTRGVYCLIRHPESSRVATDFVQVGFGLSVGSGCGACGVAGSAAAGAESTRRRSCCGYSLGRSTRRTVPERGGWFRGFISVHGRLLLVLKHIHNPGSIKTWTVRSNSR
jgi:hypothetical protein